MKKTIITLLSVVLMTAATPAMAKGKSCKDFKTQKEAQAYFNAKKPGHKRLDRDKDGIACEKLK